MSGSEALVPQPEIDYLCSKGLVVVLPNYRLAPQAPGRTAFVDCEEAFDWCVSTLPGIMAARHGITLDTTRMVVMGHSSGGTMALHLAASKPIRAATAFCPFVYVADISTSAHKPTAAPPIGDAPYYRPTEDEWAVLAPAGLEVTEAPSPLDVEHPRGKWAAHVLRAGEWMKYVAPDGDFAAIDPMTRLGGHWASVMLVHGSEDHIPGRSLELMQRAVKDMESAGIEVQLEIVDGQGHLFDHHPAVGRSDLGPSWKSVVRGLEFIVSRV